eukprot:617964-Lingulodinium_polyedra.AAC.1
MKQWGRVAMRWARNAQGLEKQLATSIEEDVVRVRGKITELQGARGRQGLFESMRKNPSWVGGGDW